MYIHYLTISYHILPYLTISYHNTFQILLSNQLGQSKLKRQPQGAFNKRCSNSKSVVVFQTLVIIYGWNIFPFDIVYVICQYVRIIDVHRMTFLGIWFRGFTCDITTRLPGTQHTLWGVWPTEIQAGAVMWFALAECETPMLTPRALESKVVAGYVSIRCGSLETCISFRFWEKHWRHLFWMAFPETHFSWTFRAIRMGLRWNHKFWSFGSEFFFQLQLSSALPPIGVWAHLKDCKTL